ncbi:MAG: NosD domain-containing protein, partial [Candidatus Helarchaeota archaeon]
PNCVVKDNFIYNNTNYGITLYDNYTQLSHNMVSGNDVGFYLGSTSSVSVYSNLSANIIANNREGIRLLKNYNCTIRDNQIYNNSEAGIFLDESHNTVISNNSIRDNSEGIHLWETFNTTIQLKEITNNETGIYLEEALAPKIIYNDIFNNTQCGIYIDNANESLITWNMIFDNGVIIKELSGVNNTIEKNFCYSGTSLDPITPNPSIDGWITLNWDAVSWATYYLVYRRYNVPFTTVYDFVVREPIKNVTTNTALDNNIPAKGMYFYTIIAGNETGWSIWSNNRWVNVTGYPVPESTILDPLITPNYNGQIELRWSVVINATYYYVYRQTSKITDVTGLIPIKNTTGLTWTDVIFNNITYFYVIVAGNLDYNSSISNCENVTVVLYPPTNVPTLASISPSEDNDGIIELNWTNCINTLYYYIYRDTTIITDVSHLTPIAIVGQTSYVDILSVNGTMFYSIVAANPTHNSSVSNCQNVTVILYPTISTPILNTMPSSNYDGLVTISWSYTSDTVSYYIYRDTSFIINVSALVPILRISAPQLEYTDVVSANITYFYAVVAGNPSHNSSVSNCRSVIVILYPIPTVPNLYPIIDSDNGKVFLNWSSAINTINYYIYRDTVAILDPTGLRPIGVTSQTFYWDTLDQNGTYYYVIVASNPSHNSSASNYHSVNVVVFLPTNEPGKFHWYIVIVIIVGAVVAVLYVRVGRQKKEFPLEQKFSKVQIQELRANLRNVKSVQEKIQLLKENAILLSTIFELQDTELSEYFGQYFTSPPIHLIEFLQRLDASLEDKREILKEFNNLTAEQQKEFLDELPEFN